MFDKALDKWNQLIRTTWSKRHEVEWEQGWIGEADTMPLLKFPSEWRIRIIPPFGDVVIRFRITLPSGLEKSVFLDSRCSMTDLRDRLGKPVAYWEVSPVGKKLGRCEKYNIETLLELIGFEEE
jgi:hypothetical protein